MRIQRVVWLPDIEDKLSHKHQVFVDEVEEVLFDSQPHIRFVEKGLVEGEDMYAAYGRTATGRWLIVFFIRKGDNEVLVVSARNMERKERRLYVRK